MLGFLKLTLLLMGSLLLTTMALADLVVRERPAKLTLPAEYDSAKKYPLVVLLHGYGSNANQTDAYLGGTRLQNKWDYILLTPEGTEDTSGRRFWNAAPECCDFGRTGVDDSSYLQELIQLASKSYSIDPNRIIVIGHSNGGFMAHRLACDAPQLFSTIIPFAGVAAMDPDLCDAKGDLPNIIHIHGDADDVVPYLGSEFFLSAEESVQRWALRHQCQESVSIPNAKKTTPGDRGQSIDIQTYFDCASEKNVELWRVREGSHVPNFNFGFIDLISPVLTK